MLLMTPGPPRLIARRLENKEDKLNAENHETYRSGVGTLLYLTKHSRPDISNPVRELSKNMDAPAQAHLKEMYKHIRFVLSRKDYGLKFKLMKSNPVRELSKNMDAPAQAHLKEMYKHIRFVLSRKDYGLKFKLMKSMRKWVLKALSYSDFASDEETRISIFGYIIYFC